MNKQNMGRISFPMELIEHEPDTVAAFLKALSFVPLRAEITDFGHQIDYLGLSPQFRPVEEGTLAPFYIIEIRKEPDGKESLHSIKEA